MGKQTSDSPHSDGVRVALFGGDHLGNRGGAGYAVTSTVEVVQHLLGDRCVVVTSDGNRLTEMDDLADVATRPTRLRRRLIREVQEHTRFPLLRLLTGSCDVYHYIGTAVRPRVPYERLIMAAYDLGGERWPDEQPYPPWAKTVLRRAAAVITISNFSKQELCSYYDIPSDRVAVVYIGCDHARFRPQIHNNPVDAVSNDQQVRTALAMNGGIHYLDGIVPRYILCAGGITQRKNVVRLLQAYAQTLSARLDSAFPSLIITGVDPISTPGQGYLALARSLGIVERVTLPGYLPDEAMPALYRHAVAVVVPSLYEGFGLPVVEAMASGTPVLSSIASSLPEVAGDAALMVDASSVDKLAAGLAGIVDDEYLRVSLRARGLARAADFTWDRCARETVALYEEVARSADTTVRTRRTHERGRYGSLAKSAPSSSVMVSASETSMNGSALSQLRVLMMPSAFHPHKGGVEEIVRQLAREYRHHGHAVSVLTPLWPHELPTAEKVGGQQVLRVAMPLPSKHLRSLASFLLRFPSSVTRTLYIGWRWRPDVVHVQCVGPNGLYALIVSLAFRLPLLVTVYGEQTVDAGQIYQRSAAQRWVLRRLLKRAVSVSGDSAYALSNLAPYGFTPSSGTVVHNGIDLNEFDAASSVRPHSRPYIFAIGRHVATKGFDVLLSAWATLAHCYPDLDLIVAGDGPDHEAFVALARQLDLDDRVCFVGRTDRAATIAYFRHSALFVLPSLRESFPVVNLEALAAGCPVVVTDVGGVDELVRDGETGLVVLPSDVAALAHAMARLLDDPSLARSLGTAGARLVRQSYTWERAAATYLATYRIILAPRGRQSSPSTGRV